MHLISEWLVPWREIDNEDVRNNLVAELHRELDADHPLRGLAVVAVARRQDNDEVLFSLADGRVAVVHLAWIGKHDRSPHPWTELYPTPDAFARDRMMSDHRASMF